MKGVLQLANCVAGRTFFFKYMYVSQDFDFKNDIVINVGNAADLETHCKNLKNFN